MLLNKRHFYTYHPEDGSPIVVVEGEEGYAHVYVKKEGLIESPDQQTLDNLNAANGNTEQDCAIAVVCSMFGWNIPRARELSNPIVPDIVDGGSANIH